MLGLSDGSLWPNVALIAVARRSQSILIEERTTLAKARGVLTRVRYRFQDQRGNWKENSREIYDNGNSAVALPFDPERRTVLLARQLRMPPFLQDGRESFLEACAGKLEGEDPENRMVKEIEEELGYRIDKLDRLFELYMSPAGFMEKITFFTCRYSPADQVSGGGGLADEGEDIEVVEVDIDKASAMIGNDIVDAKTVILIQCLTHSLRESGQSRTAN
jgi:GDP-mannose pyrophosphatase NudK